ncbi:MAG: hypothetical protein JWM80_5257 [Cyanobacteria bacterium RYN_339]|nr:hypothetical protein [Cyanobacteria bacterium RYN_339]
MSAEERRVPVPRGADSTFMVQLLLIGVILPLAFFFLLQAEHDLGPALLLRYTETKVADGRVVAVAPTSATLEYAAPEGKLVRAFTISKDASLRLQKLPRVPVRFTTRDPHVAALADEPLPVADGLGFLIAGLVFLVAGLAAGLAIWSTPDGKARKFP